MLYYYEKRNIDTVDEVVDSDKTISTIYSFYDNKVYGISQNTPYPVASYSKNGLYYTNREAYMGEMGAEFLVHNNRIAADPPAGMGFSYKIKKTMTSASEVKGIFYKATITKGEVIEHVIAEEGMYPDDGIQGDYWYVKKSRAINFKYKDSNGIVYDIAEAKYKDVNGNIVDIASAIYKDSDGNLSSDEVVDPEIPTDGLVCYLDTRGKTNTDADRETLLDLSGNGNHGTLQNFNFTEESGYGSDGLVFDGVDDFIEKSFTQSNDYTILLDFNPLLTTANDIYLDTGKILFYYWNMGGIFNLRVLGESGSYNYIDFTKAELIDTKLIISASGSTGKVAIKNKTTPINDVKSGFNNISIAKKTLSWGSFGKIDFRKLAIWNRALTDEEIQNLIGG